MQVPPDADIPILAGEFHFGAVDRGFLVQVFRGHGSASGDFPLLTIWHQLLWNLDSLEFIGFNG